MKKLIIWIILGIFYFYLEACLSADKTPLNDTPSYKDKSGKIAFKLPENTLKSNVTFCLSLTFLDGIKE